MYSDPLAYFITWTVRGQWFHGDERGSVDRAHNEHGTPGAERSQQRVGYERSNLNRQPFLITAGMRQCIESAIEGVCVYRDWNLIALNVRTNHVHAVVAASEESPERVMNDFKAWSTRRMREAGLIDGATRPWTRHGCTRRLWNEDSVVAARHYVTDLQGDALPGSVFEPPEF